MEHYFLNIISKSIFAHEFHSYVRHFDTFLFLWKKNVPHFQEGGWIHYSWQNVIRNWWILRWQVSFLPNKYKEDEWVVLSCPVGVGHTLLLYTVTRDISTFISFQMGDKCELTVYSSCWIMRPPKIPLRCHHMIHSITKLGLYDWKQPYFPESPRKSMFFQST